MYFLRDPFPHTESGTPMRDDRPLIVGIGNPDRGDDAIGLAVAERLVDDGTVVLSSGDPTNLIAAWEHRNWVIVIDAVRTNQLPGTVTILELLDEPILGGVAHSSHSLGPVEAVQIGAALGTLPERVTLVGIEATSFVVAGDMSEPVRASIDPSIRAVRSLIGQASASSPPAH